MAVLWSARFLRTLSDVTNGFRAYRMSLLDDPRVDLSQDWLGRYELEYYLHYKVLSLGYRYAEVPVTNLHRGEILAAESLPSLDDGERQSLGLIVEDAHH